MFTLEVVGYMAKASLTLQKGDITLGESNQVIEDLCVYLERSLERERVGRDPRLWPQTYSNDKAKQKTKSLFLKPNDLHTFRKTLMADSKFAGILVSSNKKYKKIHFVNFVEKFKDQVEERSLNKNQGVREALSQLNVGKLMAAKDAEYGVQAISTLIQKTKVVRESEKDALIHEIRLFIDMRNSRPNESIDLRKPEFSLLRRVLNRAWSLVPTSANVERYFSRMNLIHTRGRYNLLVKTVNDLMMLRENGPPPALFDARRAAVLLIHKRDFNPSVVKDIELNPRTADFFSYLMQSQSDILMTRK